MPGAEQGPQEQVTTGQGGNRSLRRTEREARLDRQRLRINHLTPRQRWVSQLFLIFSRVLSPDICILQKFHCTCDPVMVSLKGVTEREDSEAMPSEEGWFFDNLFIEIEITEKIRI